MLRFYCSHTCSNPHHLPGNKSILVNISYCLLFKTSGFGNDKKKKSQVYID